MSMDEYIVSDTTVLSFLSKASTQRDAYSELLGERRIAISFQTRAELLSSAYQGRRKVALDALIAATLRLQHSEATDI
jgi:hypothetical protein